MRHEFIYRVLAALPAPPGQSWAILVFHRVVPDETFAGAPVVGKLAVRLGDFRKILDWLALNALVVSLDDGVDALRGKRRDDRRPLVSLTFDDGYKDNLVVAAPELTRRSMPGTFYVASDYLDRVTPYWWDVVQLWSHQRGLPSSQIQKKIKALHGTRRHVEVERMAREAGDTAHTPACLTREDVRSLSALGMTVGNHTASHPELDQLAPSEIRREIVSAHGRLAELLPVPPQHFAFPEGCVAPAADEVLAALGYRTAVTTQHGRNNRGTDRFRLRRIDGRYLVGDRGFSRQRARFWVSSALGVLPSRRRG